MADSVVTFLLENLSQLLAQQSRLLYGVEDRVKLLHNELRMINVFLKNTEGKRNEDELVKEVVNQIRDVANEAEDVIDTFILNAVRYRKRSMFGKFIHSSEYASVLGGVANKIESIKDAIKEIYDNRDKYGIEIAEGDAEAEESLHRRRRYVEEDNVVGFVDDSDALVKQLIEGVPQPDVVSIIGMGGLGKTTLAKKIYNNDQVKNHFDYRVWVYVSQEYRTRELFLEILRGVMPMKVRKCLLKAELKEELFQGLKDKCSSNMDILKEIVLLKDLKGTEKEDDDKFKKALFGDLERIQQKYYAFKGLSDLKEEFFRGLKDKCSSNMDKLKEMNNEEFEKALFEELGRIQIKYYESNGGRSNLKVELFKGLKDKCSSNMDKLKEMNNEEFEKALFEDCCIQEKYFEFQGGLSDFVRDIYRKNDDEFLKQQVEDLQDFSDEDLKRLLFAYLRGRRYLIVMDDVWKPQLWDEVRTVFPDDLDGNRILITSRLKEVASHASTTPPYFLPFLGKEESWELFSKKVFRGGRCPPELEALGREIAESCHGLPLALVVLGGLLANKEKTHRTWSKYIGHVNSYLTQDKTQCLDILALSYNHLPRRLKPCFLYLGVYPEDFEIPIRRLIQLWIAEGFIQQIGSRNLVDIAEDYLEELIDRSLIQVASKRTDGGVKTCRIHDLLRDLSISESLNDKFLEVHRDVNHLSMSKPRRLSILCSASQHMSSSPCDPSSVRSFLCFGQDEDLFKTDQWIWLYKSVKLVRVLDLWHLDLQHSIPNKIGKLIHIRYLRIKSKDLKAIPASICNLWNLETLDMKGSPVKYLPKGIWKLQRLRHLYLSGPPSLPDPPRIHGKPLWNLQVISTIALDKQTASLMVKAKFPNVTKLGLYFTENNKRSSREILENLHHLHHLQKLKIIETSELPSSPNSFPLTLTKISLTESCSLHFDCMRILGNLPKLQILKLFGRYDGLKNVNSELICIAGGFPRLRVLQMTKLDIKKWKLSEGAMPCLQRVVIKECKNLIMLPDQLCCLTALQDVEVLWPSSALKLMLHLIKLKDGCNLLIYPPFNSTSRDWWCNTIVAESRTNDPAGKQQPKRAKRTPTA